MQKFLVIQTAFIGDVVLATALIEKLHACYPDARIDFLVRKGNEALLTGHPYLTEVLIWDKKQNKFKNLLDLTRRIRKTKYDKVINVQRFAATGLLTTFSGAKETIGFDKNPLSRFFTHRIPHIVSAPEKTALPMTGAGAPLHEIERNQALIAAFTDDKPAKPRLYPTPTDEDKVKPYKTKPYITISPASVWFTKQYPKEKWISFIQNLPPQTTVYLLGAPSDKDLCQYIQTNAPGEDIIDLSGRLTFLQSTALMRDAVMNYVNDSAPMHFASAVNAPVTAVYCSTIPAFGFGPLSDKSYIVETPEPLDCRPCGLHGYKACPRGHFNCANKIQDRQLLETMMDGRPSVGY
ncbi:glycosyltransferase family 9 protein [Puia dinghuensis]|uniref:ADP-heptose--LPS heptosyltransferase II n=1 Tax=Puia dinghuensis TaxID=1792502 RepID=A0A8J2XTA6_9BACT|nr:glycosyltransferase family 9 protein [Puia dinghuensis]GGA97532.1 ADP-heptose--LPS heptosyltransferase II [Puia dinghuensis]